MTLMDLLEWRAFLYDFLKVFYCGMYGGTKINLPYIIKFGFNLINVSKNCVKDHSK